MVLEATRLAPSLPPSLYLLKPLSSPFPRETMVVTKTYCELLYVEADNIRRIYEVFKLLLSPLTL